MSRKIHLSVRMRMILEMLQPTPRLLDVGCDHGYLSVAAVERNIAATAVAIDVRSKPLEKATNLISKCNLQHSITTDLSDGLNNIELSRQDAIIIAGMGGIEIGEILRRTDLAERNKIGQVILHPTRSAYELRKVLQELHLDIVDERLCREKEKIYVIIKAVPVESNPNPSARLSEAELFFGPCLWQELQTQLKSEQTLDTLMFGYLNNRLTALNNLNYNTDYRQRCGLIRLELEGLYNR